jgi:hypothetical protein
MGVTLHLAWILGPFYLVVGIWLLANSDRALKMLAALKKGTGNDPVLLYGAFMNLILGLLTLSFYREWIFDYQVIITLTGWLCIVKGVVLMFKPDIMLALKLKKAHVMFCGLVFLAAGGVLVNAVYNLV